MNRVMTLGALALVAAPVALLAQSQSRDEAALARLIDEFTGAQARYDQRALAALLVPDYLEVSPVGDVDTRDEVLSFYAPDKKRLAPALAITERIARFAGDNAVVVARLGFAMSGPNGATRTMAMRATYVARRVGRDWKLAAAHYTPIRSSGS